MESAILVHQILPLLSIRVMHMVQRAAFTRINGNTIRHQIALVEHAKKAGKYEKYQN
ncbi:hypothetical protein ACO0LE_16065 [Undibacterium sp. Xuan67W]